MNGAVLYCAQESNHHVCQVRSSVGHAVRLTELMQMCVHARRMNQIICYTHWPKHTSCLVLNVKNWFWQLLVNGILHMRQGSVSLILTCGNCIPIGSECKNACALSPGFAFKNSKGQN